MTPFVSALGKRLDELHPVVRAHFAMPEGTRRYEGRMTRIWRRRGIRGFLAGLFLRMASSADMLFPETGRDVPFRLEHQVKSLPYGGTSMVWSRTFAFPGKTRRFDAIMKYSLERRCIVDWLGDRGRLEAELHPDIHAGAMHLSSGKQWLRMGQCKIPLPRWIAGTATIDEWANKDGSIGIRVTIHNPLLGAFFGYEGSFVEVATNDARTAQVPALVVPPSATAIPAARWLILGCLAVVGTIAIAVSFRWLPEIPLSRVASAVGVGAGVGWLGFGGLLLRTSPRSVSPVIWVDLCLRTMAIGLGMLSLGFAANLAYGLGTVNAAPRWYLHTALIAASDLAMAIYFIRCASRQGLSVVRALTLWICGLNGLCVVIVAILLLVT